MKNLCDNKYYQRGFKLGYEFGYGFLEEKDKLPDSEKKNFEYGYNDGCSKFVAETDGGEE